MDSATTRQQLCDLLGPKGFECYPFKIGWYNELVAEEFRLPFEADTLAFMVISTPDMFELTFKPFVCQRESVGEEWINPIDECVEEQFAKIRQIFPDQEVEWIHGFELHHPSHKPNYRPKVLVQTAAHVAGAAYYYQRKDVQNDPWPTTKKINGVSVHPQFGCYFALRGVTIFKSVLAPDLERKSPPDCVLDNERRIQLLDRFNFHSRDFRDVIPANTSYSQEQKKYFLTPKRRRDPLLAKIWEEGKASCSATRPN